MKDFIVINEGIMIPGHEIEITTSRSGGAGGQHVNKTDTRVTVRWNAMTTKALKTEQKERVQKKLQKRLTTDGDLIIHYSASRSQQENKEMALQKLADIIQEALRVPKKRMATRISKTAKEVRLLQKKYRSNLKDMRSKKSFDD